MAFTLVASVDDVSTTLNDGNPFSLESAEGLSGASIVRHEQSGPLQGGVTDLGYRVVPRTITLNLLFRADTDAALDAHRDTLLSTFKPLTGISIFLTATRDDDEIRKLVCHAVDDIAIALAPELRPGHMHRATVRLRAADPLWQSQEAVPTTIDYGTADQWYLAGGAIDEADILHVTEYPSAGNWWYPGTAWLTEHQPQWAVAIVTAQYNGGTVPRYAFAKSGGGISGTANLRYMGTIDRYAYNAETISDTGFLWPGTSAENVHFIGFGDGSLGSFWAFNDGGTLTFHSKVFGGEYSPLGGQGQWRRLDPAGPNAEWPAIRKAMIWTNTVNNSALEDDMQALIPYMLAQSKLGTTYTGTVNVVNDGDVAAYPFITLRGPLKDPVIANTTTGGSLDLTGLTVPNGATYVVDLRGGDKTITDLGGNNMMGSVTTFPVSMADFAIAPSPTAAGGTNVLTVTSGSAGSVASFTLEITPKYMSF